MITQGRTCMVVAHPDDESMWGAGLALTEHIDTIICCSIPRTDPIRAWKFFDACEVVGAKGRILPCAETAHGEILNGLHEIDLSGFDTIVTHNDVGEYGHTHHRFVHVFVRETFKGRIATFGYGDPMAKVSVPLGEHGWKAKLKAIKCYDHVLPYEGKPMPKWEALLHRYGTVEGWNLAEERYRIYAPVEVATS